MDYSVYETIKSFEYSLKMIISRLTTAFRCLHRFQKSPTVIRVIRNHTRDLSTDDDAFDTQFGKRHLEDEQRVFQQNAWDDVRWDEDLLNEAKEKTRLLNSQFMSKEESDELERNAADRWNQFYANHAKGFFRERSWLFRVFPDLREALEKIEVKDGDKVAIQPSSSRHSTQVKVLEVGCGPGSAVIPLLQNPLSRRMLLYCCDFSDIAIDMLKNNEAYDRDLCRAFQWDITDTEREIPIQDGSLDFISVLFVLSTIDPSHISNVIRRLSRLLRPGGRILFRDYGRYDLSQLRLKPGSAIAENFYSRGNGTRVYFFTTQEIHNLFTAAGLEEEFLRSDNKLAVNRKLQLKMYRVWILAQYRKPD